MTEFKTQNPAYRQRVEEMFARQGLMTHLGARLLTVDAGRVDIEMPYREAVTQQHGFAHAGALSSIADSACGFAALTLMPPGSLVLSTEFKVNFLAPGRGERFVARAVVLKPGRTITVCQADVFGLDSAGQERHCMTMLASMIRRDPT